VLTDVGADALVAVREVRARQDWQAMFDAASAAPVDSPALEAERADLLAEAAWGLGRLDECIAAREDAYLRYGELGDDRRAGMCAVWLWEYQTIAARPAIAGAWLRRARRALGNDPGSAEYGALLLREAETAHGHGQLDAALDLASRAIALGRHLGSADLEAEGLQTAGRVRIERGEVTEGMGDLDEAMLLAVEGRLGPYATGKVYCSLISACEDVGDLNRAAEWTEATMRWARQHPFAIFPGICRVHRAVVLKRRGALVEAEREAMLACQELAGRHVANTAAAYAEVGDICRRLGALDRAEDAFGRSQELAGKPCGALALLRLAQGRTAQALTIATGCLRDTTNRLGRIAVLPILIHVAVAAGELDTARDALAELDDIAAAFGTAVFQATALSARGRLDLANGDPAAARVVLRDAVERWQTLGIPYEVATARTLLGQALRDTGDESDAVESFTAAAALFDEIGAHLDARLLVGDHTPALPSGLTPREAEVLRLVAAGMTNNEIASSLHLSIKTVSRHISNIFTKIGVTSRTAATVYAFEHGLVETRT
jgi:ATP/maltotriose-dependent transcriptional regulator MalT